MWSPPSMGRLFSVCQNLGCQACTIQENCSSRPALSRAMAWEYVTEDCRCSVLSVTSDLQCE